MIQKENVGIFIVAMMFAMQVWKSQAQDPTSKVKPSPQAPVDFQSDLLPIFRANCLACHSRNKSKGGLNLESPQTILEGSDAGPVIIPGKGNESHLFLVASNLIEDALMPPKDNPSNAVPMKPTELELLKRWIDEGATGKVDGSAPVTWQTMPSSLQAIHAVTLSPDGAFAACSRANHIDIYRLPEQRYTSRLYDPALMDTEQEDSRKSAHLDFVQSLAFSTDGGLLASGGYRVIKLWKRVFETGMLPMKVPSLIQRACFDPFSLTTCLILQKGGVIVWDGKAQESMQHFQMQGHEIQCAITSPNREWLAAGSREGHLLLWSMADGTLLQETSMDSPITHLQWTPDASMLFGADSKQLIRQWRITASSATFSAQLKTVWLAHESTLTTLGFSSSETPALVSGSHDGTLKWWDPDSGALMRTVTTGDAIRDMAISPDGLQIGILQKNGSIQIWKEVEDTRLTQMQPHPKPANELARAEQRKTMADAWLEDNRKDLENLKKEAEKAAERTINAVEALAVADTSLKEKKAAIKSAQHKADQASKLLNAYQSEIQRAEDALAKAQKKLTEAKEQAARTVRNTLDPPQQEANPASVIKIQGVLEAIERHAFAAGRSQEAFDQTTANKEDITAQHRKAVEETQKQLEKLQGEQPPLEMQHALARTETQLAETRKQHLDQSILGMQETIASRENEVSEAIKRVNQAQTQLKQADTRAHALAFNNDGSMLSAVGTHGNWMLWSTKDGFPLEASNITEGPLHSIHFHAEDRRWIISGREGWIWRNEKPSWTLTGQLGNGQPDSPIRDRVNALTFSPNGLWLASGGGQPSRNGEILIWNIQERSLTHDLDRIHSDAVLGLAFSPDGQHLASCASDKMAKIMDCETWNIEKTLEGHTHHVMDISWQSNGRMLATGGADKKVKLWAYPEGNRKKNIEGFDKEITGVAFVGLSNQFIASSGDAKLRLLDTEGKEVRSFKGIQAFQHTASVTPDGHFMAIGGEDGHLRFYDLDAGKAIGSHGIKHSLNTTGSSNTPQP
jgi:WD40 repeat protein